ncbi:MAG: magnesium transporter CorA family protein [Patescibacteria group bacterium]
MVKIIFSSVRDTKMSELPKLKRGSWIQVVNPTHDELQELDNKYQLDVDILRDGVDLYESPRIEREDNALYIFTRYSRPEGKHSSTEPLLIVLTSDFILTLSKHDPTPLVKLLDSGKVNTTQKNKLLLQIFTAINTGYRENLLQVNRLILASRARLQSKIISDEDLLTYIDTEEDLNEFLVSLQPYGILLNSLVHAKYINFHEEDLELVEDLELSTSELIELTKSRLITLQNLRNVYSTLVTNNLNRVFKRLTSIAIFLSVPTVIGGLYGMNVVLPLSEHPQAFWIVFGIILLIVGAFVSVFRWRRWL